jgi:hypothetical protein
VAQYADGCNVFGDAERIAAKYAVLREHCEAIGRPYDAIERSTLQGKIDLERASTGQLIERFGSLGEAGAQQIIVSVVGINDTSKLERLAADVLDPLRGL